MLHLSRALYVSVLLMFSFNANADFWSGDDCPPWEYDCNDWPEWSPMYWMEEMSDEFDDDDDYYRYGGGPYGGPYGRPPMMPYGRPPMPYGAPAPYGAPQRPAPRPYGAPAPTAPPVK